MWSKILRRSFSTNVILKDWTAANVANWVAHVHGRRYAAYADAFLQHEIDMELLAQLSDLDLRQLGVTNLSDRKKLLSSVEKLVSYLEKREDSSSEWAKMKDKSGLEDSSSAQPKMKGDGLQTSTQVRRSARSATKEREGLKISPSRPERRPTRPWQEQLKAKVDPGDHEMSFTQHALLSSTPEAMTTPWDRPATLPHNQPSTNQGKRIKIQTQARTLPSIWSHLESRHPKVSVQEFGEVEEFEGEPRHVYEALVDVYDHFRRVAASKAGHERAKRPDYLDSIKSIEEFRLTLVNHEESLFWNTKEVLGEKLLALYEVEGSNVGKSFVDIIDSQPLLVPALLGAAAVRGVVLSPEIGLQMLPHLSKDPLVWADFWDVAVDVSNRDTVCIAMLKSRLLETGKDPFWKSWLEGLVTRRGKQPRPLAHALLALETLHESSNYIWTLDRLGWTCEEKLSHTKAS